MKFIKIAGACVVVAVVIGALMASASYAYLPDWGIEGPLATSSTALATTTPGPASSRLARETAVLTRQGVSLARAREALRLQSEVAETHLGESIETALGSDYAGAWFEPAAAKYHIGVTSNSSSLAAKRIVAQTGLARNVVETPVRSTFAALIATQTRWGKKLAKLVADQEATTGLDPRQNAVSITLSSVVPLPERTAIEHEAATASANVFVTIVPPSQLHLEKAATCKFETQKAYCEKTIVSGVTIVPPKPNCTAGPMLISGNETYMLTAGHCFGEKNGAKGTSFENIPVTSSYPKAGAGQKEIGKEGIWYENKERDFAEVKVTSPEGPFSAALPTPVPALMAQWGKEGPSQVIGETKNEVGQMNCHQGQTSGEHCGEVTELDIEAVGTEHLVKDSACGEKGDSGGPFYIATKSGALMQGVLVVVPFVGTCSEGAKETVYEPLIGLAKVEQYGILSTFSGQTLLTTKNEVRPAPPIVLPEVKEEEKWTGESGKSALEVLKRAATIECTKDKSEGTFEAKKPLGLFHIDFEGCKASGFTCTGLGEANGVILTLGTAHLVYDKLGPELGVGMLFLVEASHFTCFISLSIIEGQVLCLIKPIDSKTKHWEIICEKGKETGDTGETVYWNEAGTEIKMGEELLLTKENEGAGVMSSLNTVELILTTVDREIMG